MAVEGSVVPDDRELRALLGAARTIAVRARAGDGSVPAWTVWLLRGQMVLVYFYAGVAKLNPD